MSPDIDTSMSLASIPGNSAEILYAFSSSLMSIAGVEKLNELRHCRFDIEHPAQRRETEPAAEPIEQPVHFAAERLQYVGDSTLRRRRFLHFNRYLCHFCLRRSVGRKRVYLGRGNPAGH